jgi:hypothetical protein
MTEPTPILKEEAIAAFGTGAALAAALGIAPSAVYQWEDGQPIPEKQALRLRYQLKPELFGSMPDGITAGQAI